MFEFRTNNELVSSNQSGFKPYCYCINQLLCISHVIYQSFDDRLETRTVILELSKAFNKVWHGSLLYKLKQNGISHNPLNSIIDVLNQRIILNGHYSIRFDIEARVSQGSILGPLFFPIY